MTNKPKNIGTKFETNIVNYLLATGWPKATRRVLKGRLDEGDVVVCEGLMIEAKGGAQAENASDGQLRLWLEETVKEAFNAREQGFLVVKRKGHGIAKAGGWWVVQDTGNLLTRFRLDEYLEFLKAVGWTANGFVEKENA